MVKLVAKGDDDAKYLASVKAGEYLFREGDAPADLFIIQDGQVELLKGAGAEEARLALLDPGEFFGERSLLDGQPREAAARAVTDCKLLKIDGSAFGELVRREPEIAVRMIRRLSRRLSQSLEAGLEAARAAAWTPASAETNPVPVVRPSAAEGPTAKKEVRVPGLARLVHESGSQFPLPPSVEAVVGRADPAKGFTPEIDLSSVDAQRSLSRRHARLRRVGEEFYVLEEPGVRNGTFVNGKRLKAGAPVKVADGDEVSFGLIKTTFRVG